MSEDRSCTHCIVKDRKIAKLETEVAKLNERHSETLRAGIFFQQEYERLTAEVDTLKAEVAAERMMRVTAKEAVVSLSKELAEARAAETALATEGREGTEDGESLGTATATRSDDDRSL